MEAEGVRVQAKDPASRVVKAVLARKVREVAWAAGVEGWEDPLAGAEKVARAVDLRGAATVVENWVGMERGWKVEGSVQTGRRVPD